MSRAEEQALKAYPNIKIGEQHIDQSPAREVYVQGYEQAIKDMKETFEEMSKNTNNAIDAVKAIGSLLDNPDIREKLGKSKPIPKKPIKTNPFFGGDKK